MALTASAVFVAPNRIRYLLQQDGAAGTTLTITTTGAATPDLLTDSVGGQIKQLARIFTDGFQQFGAGAKTQAQARAIWLSDFTGTVGTPAGALGASAECVITPRTGSVVSAYVVDANVDGPGHPTLTLAAQATAGSAYLDVFIPNQIGA